MPPGGVGALMMAGMVGSEGVKVSEDPVANYCSSAGRVTSSQVQGLQLND